MQVAPKGREGGAAWRSTGKARKGKARPGWARESLARPTCELEGTLRASIRRKICLQQVCAHVLHFKSVLRSGK